MTFVLENHLWRGTKSTPSFGGAPTSAISQLSIYSPAIDDRLPERCCLDDAARRLVPASPNLLACSATEMQSETEAGYSLVQLLIELVDGNDEKQHLYSFETVHPASGKVDC